MRRLVQLLSAVFLLCSAATAHAECAWVLWATSTQGRFFPSERSVIVSAFGTLADCKTEATRYRSAVTVLADSGMPVIAPEGFKPENPNSPRFSKPGYQCLPDTVDPRGPKGK